MNKIPIAKTIIENRICWACKYVLYSPGERNYSELTPGWDASLECGKGYWKIDFNRDYLSSVREKLTSAIRCAEYSE